MIDMLVEVRPDERRRRPHDLVNTISLIGHLLEQRMDQELSSVGLTARQYQALVHIANTPRLCRGALARLLRVSPQGAGALTRRLREAGLIQATEAAPGYPVSFSVTPSGRETLLDAQPIAIEADRNILAGLSEAAVKSVADAMRILARQIR